jgi:hypothetical protein
LRRTLAKSVLSVLALKARRRLVAESRVPAPEVVPPLDVAEHGHRRLSPGAEPASVDELTLQRRKRTTRPTEFSGRPWEEQAREIMIAQSPYFNCGGVKAATLFVHGEVDYRVPLEGAIQLYTCLKKQRIPTRMIIYEGQAHGNGGHWNNVHRMMYELR